MTEGDLEPLRQARERMAARIDEAIFRKMQRGTLAQDDTPDDLEITAVGHCLELSMEAYDEIAKGHNLPTLREHMKARAASFPPCDPGETPF